MSKNPPYRELENARVMLWQDRKGVVYKIGIIHKDYTGYSDPEKLIVTNG